MSWLARWRGLDWDPLFGAGWFTVLLLAAAVAYSVYLYRRGDAPLGTALRGLLAGLRAAALVLLLLVLARPVLSLAVPGGAARGVLVLADRSSSMTLPGRAAGDSRDDELSRALARIDRALSETYPVRVRAFSSEAGPLLEDPAALPPPRGETTDLARALEGASAGVGSEGKPGAVVLISDGTATAGSDPVTAARRLGIPVEVVALGSPDPVPDLAVSRVRANVEAFAGERTPVEAFLRLQGLEPAAVTALLLDVTEGEAVVAQATTRVEPGGAETKVTLSFVPTRVGLRFFEVRVPVLPGEVAGPNNCRVFSVDVREEKTGVLLLSGSLTWDHTFLRRALEADSTLGLAAGLRRGNIFQTAGDSRPLPALDAAGLRGTRVVMLDHTTPAALGRAALEALAGFVRGGGGLVLLTGGRSGDLSQWENTPLASLLPVLTSGSGGEVETPVRLGAAARRHVLFDPTAPGSSPLDAWRDLPPLAVAPDLGGLRAGGEALLVTADRELPVLAWTPAGQGRVLLLSAGGLWRWQFMSSTHGPGATLMPAWWRRTVHWLARPGLGGQVDIRPEKAVVPRGERVGFVARITDPSYRPVAGASVELAVLPAGGDTTATRRLSLSGEGGFLTGALDPLPPGRYRFEGRARTPEGELPPADGFFLVDSLGAEMERLEADHELLERVASASGGHLWHPDSLQGLGDAMARRAAAEEERVQVALWDHPFLFVVFVILASLEWFLRRRRGLV